MRLFLVTLVLAVAVVSATAATLPKPSSAKVLDPQKFIQMTFGDKKEFFCNTFCRNTTLIWCSPCTSTTNTTTSNPASVTRPTTSPTSAITTTSAPNSTPTPTLTSTSTPAPAPAPAPTSTPAPTSVSTVNNATA